MSLNGILFLFFSKDNNDGRNINEYTTCNRAFCVSRASQCRFQGMPVMIRHVDESNETARIYEVKNPERELTVPVNSLEEI